MNYPASCRWVIHYILSGEDFYINHSVILSKDKDYKHYVIPIGFYFIVYSIDLFNFSFLVEYSSTPKIKPETFRRFK